MQHTAHIYIFASRPAFPEGILKAALKCTDGDKDRSRAKAETGRRKGGEVAIRRKTRELIAKHNIYATERDVC